MTEQKNPEALDENDLEHAAAGADGTFKFFRPNEPTKDSFEAVTLERGVTRG